MSDPESARNSNLKGRSSAMKDDRPCHSTGSQPMTLRTRASLSVPQTFSGRSSHGYGLQSSARSITPSVHEEDASKYSLDASLASRTSAEIPVPPKHTLLVPPTSHIDSIEPSPNSSISGISAPTVTHRRGSSIVSALAGLAQTTRSPSDSKRADVSRGSSMNLSTDFVSVTRRMGERYMTAFINTSLFRFVTGCLLSTKFQIYVFSIVHMLDLVVIVVLVNIIEGTVLPNIGFYNLLHAILGALGKVSLVTGVSMSQLIGKEYVASSLVKRGRGMPLSVVGVGAKEHVPPDGKTLRYIFVCSLFILEGCMWYLILGMKWNPVATNIGDLGCIPATYPSHPHFLTNVAGFLEGDTNLGTIYNYGLPLADGIVGGWAAWPTASPSYSFSVEGAGVVYAYTVTCGNLRPATIPGASKLRGTHFSLSDTSLWSNLFAATVSITFPAGAHNWDAHADEAVSQDCLLKYVMGNGVVKYAFVSDEWFMVSGGQMVSIKTNSQLVTQNMAQQLYFSQIVEDIGSTTTFIELVGWFAEALKLTLDGQTFIPTQSGKISNIIQWSRNSQDLYDVDETWEGLSGAMGSISHYILMQYNGSASANCSYFGVKQSGEIVIPTVCGTIIYSAVALCFVCHIMQMLRWTLTSGGSPKSDRVAQVLNSPLLLLYYMRRSITPLVQDVKNGNHSSRSIRRHMNDIFVRMGEDKATRGETVGTLVMGGPKNIIAMNDKREYY
ncbi:hypothetical protein BC830DRAFT_1157358 [Chytriomyces sp. MP71]|nr:hypothetical protein BC830DRAFT_1157358 [Chytriomyces sp. MP71]